jgi:putative protease
MAVSKKKKRKSRAKAKKTTRKKIVRKKVKKAKGKVSKKTRKKAPAASKSEEVLIGKVTHYFPHVKAGAIRIEKGTLTLGDAIHIKGHTTNFKQSVKSLQINRAPITQASTRDEVGILVKSRVRINDNVYKMK